MIWKKKKQEKLLEEEKKAQEAAELETVNRIKQNELRAVAIQNALRNIDFEKYQHLAENGKNRIQPETIRSYALICEQLVGVINNADISAQNYEEVDAAILEMTNQFKQSLSDGNEESASQIIKGIAKCIEFLRIPLYAADAEEQKEFERKRNQEILRISELSTCIIFIDNCKTKKEKLDEQIIEYTEKAEQANARVREMEDNDPLLERKAAEVNEKLREITPEIQRYVDYVDYAIDCDNFVSIAKLTSEMRAKELHTVENIVNHVNLMAFGAPTILGKTALSKFEDLVAMYQDDLKRAQNEMAHYQEATEQANAIYKTLFGGMITDKEIAKLAEYHQQHLTQKEDEIETEAARIKKLENDLKELEEQEIALQNEKKELIKNNTENKQLINVE